MSKLLIDDKPVMVLPKLAQAIGLNEAIVLQQIHYWLHTYEEAKKTDHYQDGRWWVYNSKEEWVSNFPWWSENTIWRALTSLRESGVVITGNYNRRGYDRTLWYTIDYAILSEWEKAFTQNGKMDLPKMGTTIPEITQETTAKKDNSANAELEQSTLGLDLNDLDTVEASTPEDSLLFEAINADRHAKKRRAMSAKFQTVAQKRAWRDTVGKAKRKYNGKHEQEIAHLIESAMTKGLTDRARIIAYVGGCFKDIRSEGEQVIGW